MENCKGIGDYSSQLNCENDLLKVIQNKLVGTSSEKEKLFIQKAQITTLKNIGNTYRELTFLSKAMEYYQMSMVKAEEIQDKLGMAIAFLSFGTIYTDRSDNSKAMDNMQKGLKLFKELHEDRGIGICLNNIGTIYQNQSNYAKALEYYQKSLIIQQARKDTFEIMTCLNNIGFSYQNLNNVEESTEYFNRGLVYAIALKDIDGNIRSLEGIGDILYSTDKFNEAEQRYKEALKLSIESDNKAMQALILKSLKNVFEKEGRYKEALAAFDKHIILQDSLFTEKQIAEIAKQEANYEFNKKEVILKAEQKKKDALAEAESKKQKIVIGAVIIGLLLVVVFAGFVFRSLRITQRQKTVIELQKGEVDKQRELADSRRIIAEEQRHVIEIQKTEVELQKKLVDEHQKEIVDSITYAKRLQQAILPPISMIRQALPQSFVLYRPKDIVAGDFYWMHIYKDTILIAAADCTGHGVSGALLSIVCSNALNRTVNEFGLTDTGKILDKVTELVLETFEASGEEIKDGMDISLLSINRTTKQIQWSGANNPLWYIHNNELIHITANKQPIGKHDNPKPFTSHSIAYEPDTTFYLFTDGYADQFGGAKGKKFKYKQLEEKLVAISGRASEDQQKILDDTFAEWKGNLEQVDDVCIIGIKI